MTKTALLITRPRASADRFLARLHADLVQDIDVILSPLLEIVPTGAAPDVAHYTGVIFTSTNAVALTSHSDGQTAFCVGRTTAHHAQSAGWKVSATEKTADDLVACIAGIKPTGPLLHLAGRHRRGDIAARLTALGINTDVETLYDQMPIALTDQARECLKGEAPVVVPLFSPRTAAHFVDQAPNLQNVTVIAMSDAVARCCIGKGAAHILASTAPTGLEMLRMVEKVLHRTSLA